MIIGEKSQIAEKEKQQRENFVCMNYLFHRCHQHHHHHHHHDHHHRNNHHHFIHQSSSIRPVWLIFLPKSKCDTFHICFKFKLERWCQIKITQRSCQIYPIMCSGQRWWQRDCTTYRLLQLQPPLVTKLETTTAKFSTKTAKYSDKDATQAVFASSSACFLNFAWNWCRLENGIRPSTKPISPIGGAYPRPRDVRKLVLLVLEVLT